MEISYRISWRRNSTAGGNCASRGSFITGEDEIECQNGCSGIITDMEYFCTDFSIDENWSFGEHTVTYNFGSLSGIVTIGTEGRAWIEPFRGDWNISTTFSLTPREDIGDINSSPQAVTIPVIRIQEGCNNTIPIAVSDPDNDIVRCRWAVGVECAGICHDDAFAGATLDSDSCTISYVANDGTGFRAAAIMVEDFLPGSLQPLSSVAIQFLAFVASSTQACNQNPTFVDPTPANGICVTIPPGETFTTQLLADSISSTSQILEIQTWNTKRIIAKDSKHK